MKTELLTALALCILAVGCEKKTEPKPDQPLTASPTGSAASVVEAPKPKPPPEPPTLALKEVFKEQLKDKHAHIYPLDKTMLVAATDKVGVIEGDSIKWLGTIPAGSEFIGPNELRWVGGTYPDAIDVTYTSMNGRAPMPTYFPLTGKGNGYTFAPGGGLGIIYGVGTLGETTIVAGYTMMEGEALITVRGPKRTLKRIPRSAHKCTDEEQSFTDWGPIPSAVDMKTFAATRAGTGIIFGDLCGKRGPVAEVWKPGKEEAELVDLKEHVKKLGYYPDFHLGPGDLGWLIPEEGPILEYRDGTFAPLPDHPAAKGEKAKRERMDLFVSDKGILHLWDGHALFAYGDQSVIVGFDSQKEAPLPKSDKPQWHQVASLTWPTDFHSLARIGDQFWGSVFGTLYKLEPTKPEPLDSCKTPFLFIYDVNSITEHSFTFPATRKALATFDKKDDISLVDFKNLTRSIGVRVSSVDVGNKLIEHLKTAMPDERPQLLCYAPKDPRVLDIDTGKVIKEDEAKAPK